MELSEEQDPAEADEPRRFLPDGRPMATKRKKKKPEPTVAESASAATSGAISRVLK